MNQLKSTFPGVIVYPLNEDDLVKSLTFAYRNRIRVVPRCSGQDLNCRSTARGAMVLRMEAMHAVTYNAADQTVTFGAGATHFHIYTALADTGRVYVGCQNPFTCAAGCLTAGCVSVLSKQYGLGSDNVLSIRIALINGTVLDTSREAHADLFHAYLGAGQAFGVAVSFTAKTQPAPPKFIEFGGVFKVKADNTTTTPNVYTRFLANLTFVQAMPAHLSAMWHVDGPNDLVYGYMVYSGNAENASDIAPLMEELTSSPYFHSGASAEYGNLLNLTMANLEAKGAWVWKRKFMSNVFVPANQTWLDHLSNWTIANRPTAVAYQTFGGAVTNGTTGVVPQGMRDACMMIAASETWDDPDQDFDKMNPVVSGFRQFYDLAPASSHNMFTTWGSAINNVSDWATRFYHNYTALLETKQAYDPCNYFTAKYAVAWDRDVGTCRG